MLKRAIPTATTGIYMVAAPATIIAPPASIPKIASLFRFMILSFSWRVSFFSKYSLLLLSLIASIKYLGLFILCSRLLGIFKSVPPLGPNGRELANPISGMPYGYDRILFRRYLRA
jgi:hypothetical protein